MDYYCEVCDKHIKRNKKCKHCKSKSHIELDKCKHFLLSLKNIDMKDVDET